MTILLVTLHIVVCFALIVVVLLQSGKGAEMGASFGASGSQSVFGAGGGSTFMSKLTTSAAIIFMLTSLALAFASGKGGGSSIMSKAPKAKPAPMGGLPLQQPVAPAAPGKTAAPAAPAAPAVPTAPAAPAQK
ncbi:preprotein translocase, SecG subunit [Citrifermentans bemidjiense Bem]|uniref:Protein-export membrane protein SecG n=1 Tax=Citrifermentans bemidjiense (strain ATCC BAA-1014 / DSM 16622 / JCM 12645 / Bem) TaxID=404380 RepID=B5EF42_CITBB|nr:preprotein translocase subunit SecG [Citrifermentans bemidjiense]ACH39351.1 preprotein translocase, SecG subunit [Citrifermentans bemidjiense Bem]